MSSIFNTEARLLLGIREDAATPGTAKPLTGLTADVRVRNLELSKLETEYDNTSSKFLTGDHTHDEAIPGASRGGIDFDIKFAPGEFHYAAGALTESRLPYGKYMESCGLAVAEHAPSALGATDGYWEFYPTLDADNNTMTLGLYDRQGSVNGVGIEYSLAGAMGNVKLSTEGAGKPFKLGFSIEGKVNDVREVAHTDLPVYEDEKSLSTLATRFLNTDIKIQELTQAGDVITPVAVSTFESDGTTPVQTYAADGTTTVVVYDAGQALLIYDNAGAPVVVYDSNGTAIKPLNGIVSASFCVNTMELDPGCNIAEIMCQSDAYSILHNTITTRDPRFTVDPLLVSLSEFNFWQAVNSSKVYHISVIQWTDNTKTNKGLELDIPRGQIIEPSGSDDNGFRRNALTIRPLRNLKGTLTPVNTRERDYTIKIWGKTLGN